MTKTWAEGNPEPVDLYGEVQDKQNNRRYQTWYEGPVLPRGASLLQWPPVMTVSESSLVSAGATAIARCSPSNPTADTSVFLKETIEEGIPHLFIDNLKKLAGGTNRQRRQTVGDAYLNQEFGWKPFVSDIQKMSAAIASADDIMRQYERDSGKAVRRRYQFPDVSEVMTDTFANNVSPWTNPSGGFISDDSLLNKGRVTRTKTTETKTWFSGAFTYYVPDDLRFSTKSGWAYAVIQARKVHGLSLTPDAVWNSAPWSWAVDWFSNTGDVLSNFSDWAIDNQVLLYGYIMQHSLQKWTYTFEGETGFRNKSFQVTPVSLCRETKVRRRATPYGFGLDFGSFSNRQKAIVAALGLSRSR